MDKLIHFTVKGMHCSSCETLIKDELSEIKGVTQIVIDHQSGQGSLISKSSGKNNQEILDAIKRAGYEAQITTKTKPENERIVSQTITADRPITIKLELKIEKGENAALTAKNNITIPQPDGQIKQTKKVPSDLFMFY